MRSLSSLMALAALTVSVGAQTPGITPRPYYTEPAISPDKREIAFVSGGDIWAVPIAGGEAHLLLSHPASESRPLYSPDGRTLAFVSTRSGGGDIYLLTLATGEVRRLTFSDGLEQLDAWSHDGRWIYFSSTSQDIGGMNDVFRVSAGGGTPTAVAADRYTNEYFSSPSPDGSALAITARATASAQWWRNGRSHLDEAEIWVVRDINGQAPRYEPVTTGGAKELWPLWSGDGRSLYYVSDRNGVQNIWLKALGASAAPKAVTSFQKGRVVWPSMAADGSLLVFEHDFDLWTLDTASGRTSRVNISRRGAPSSAGVEHVALTDQVSSLALSPDGKKVAFIVRGEVFAASAKDGGDAQRVSRTPELESDVTWAPDSRRLVYASDRGGTQHLYLYDFATGAETRLTQGNDADHSPSFSPDGGRLAYIRGKSELRVLDIATGMDRLAASGIFARPPFGGGSAPVAWSPDGAWLAFLSRGDTTFTNATVVRADGSGTPPRPISFLANAFGATVAWSRDGQAMYFDTGQRTEAAEIARIDLQPRTPRFREDQFRDLFREQPAPASSPAPPSDPAAPPVPAGAARPAGGPINVDFDGIRQRLTLLPTGVDASLQQVSPDGKTLLLIARAAGQANLYTFSIDELSRETPVARQLTSTPGAKRDAQFSPDGKEVFFLEQGRITSITLESRQARRLAVTASMDIDFSQEKMEVFTQAWSYLRDNYADPKMNGVDWNAVRDQYAPLIAGAATREEMRRLLALMVGELNSSHTGIGNPPGGGQTVGTIGLRFVRADAEARGRLTIAGIVSLSPADVAGLKVGEVIERVDGVAVGPGTNLDELLDHTLDRRVDLVVSSDGSGTNRRTVAVRPVNQTTEKNLIYRQWVEEKRAYVARVSNGRLGYVHLFNMADTALPQLYLDLDAENRGREGVVVDVRNNSGGFVNGYALDVFSRQNYLTMTSRGEPAAGGRDLLGQRALGKPTVLVTNQHSLSDAEDFTEGYRALKLGPVIGEPTAGWILYTSNMPLIDGTIVRIPRIRVDDADGERMEQSPRPVDVPVKRAVGESYSDRDAQLDTAAKALLGRLTDR